MNSIAKLALTVLSALLVVIVISWESQDTGPGPVTSVHANVAALDGGRNCAGCHGSGPAHLAGAAGVEELRLACLECHAPIAQQLEHGAGLHGQLEPAKQRLCGSCHPEHLGSHLPLTGERSFRLAGHKGPEGFDHSTIDYHLDGRHDALACVDCHPHADKAVLAEGESRYLGETQRCVDCHEDVHEGQMKRGCEECHGQEHDFEDLTAFPHDQRFPLHHSHGGLACADCHESGSLHSVEALSDPAIGQDPSRQAWRSCASCHQSPHDDAFLAGVPGIPDPGPGRDGCVLCHSEQHPTWVGDDPIFETDWHRASGFALDAPHEGLDCAACHPREDGQSFLEAYPGRAAEACADCHQDVHQGQFDKEPYLARGCLSCHTKDTFAPHTFDVDAHAKTAFALLDKHAVLDCEACHDQVREGMSDVSALAQHADPCRVFVGAAMRCEECHSDAHDGAFDAWEATLSPHAEGSCARCHDAANFRETTVPFDHLKWAGFALEQGHKIEDCEACHERSAVADEHGRTFGRVSELFPGDPAACDACHADVHRGAFDAAALQRQVEGRIGCARCHTVEEFRTLHQSFDHGAWTGFALDGAHLQSDCATCHGAATDERAFGFVEDLYPGDPDRCVTCHADPHLGIFDEAGRPKTIAGKQGCVRCHETVSFRAAALGAFDHGSWTGFSLQGAHARAQCSSCHVELVRPTDLGRSYGRAAGRSCIDCHSDPHVGQFAVEGRTNCLDCHAADASTWATPDFDHDQTRYPLDATHAKVACAECHQASPLNDGREAIRYKPLGTNCLDCHQVLPGPSGTGDGRR